MNLLDIIYGNEQRKQKIIEIFNEKNESKAMDFIVNDLITWFEMSNETIEHYDDVIREARNKLSQLTKLP